MKLGTVVRLPDGRIGTICYSWFDGEGGVWGRHAIDDDNLPPPAEFMLREKEIQQILRETHGNRKLECVGREYEVIEEGAS